MTKTMKATEGSFDEGRSEIFIEALGFLVIHSL